MCYFSRSRKSEPQKFSRDELNLLAKNLFGNALQVMVGCGAEPTVHPNYFYLVELAKKYGVPHVGMVTNGQLVSKTDLETLSRLGLNELTLSVHGAIKETYERFMVGAKWNKLIDLLENINLLKSDGKVDFSLRVNYTANPENIEELLIFFDVFGKYPINALQVRPIMDIGGSYFTPFTTESLSIYYRIIENLRVECGNRGITFLANTKNPKYEQQGVNPIIAHTYLYVSPQVVVYSNFYWESETYRHFLKRTGWHKTMLKTILYPKKPQFEPGLAERYGSQYDVL